MINLTNYNDHPTRKSYTIFHFFLLERARYFEELLLQEKIWFESEIETQPDKTIYFFGIKNSDLRKVERLNYLVSAKYRKPTIPSKPLRWVIYLLSLILLVLMVLGYLNAKT